MNLSRNEFFRGLIAYYALSGSASQNQIFFSAKSLFDRDAHFRELERIRRVAHSLEYRAERKRKTEDDIVARRILEMHKFVVEDNCAKAEAISKCVARLYYGVTGLSLLRSGLLEKSEAMQAIAKIATYASIIAGLHSLLGHQMLLAKRGMPQKHVAAIKKFANTPEELTVDETFFEPIIVFGALGARVCVKRHDLYSNGTVKHSYHRNNIKNH